MNIDKNFSGLNRFQVNYRRYPVNDQPTETFEWGWYYENGTTECYTLFNTRFTINTIKQLSWHFRVILHLNPDIEYEKFMEVSKFLCDLRNGFCGFNLDNRSRDQLIDNIYDSDASSPPPNKLRKVIFKDFCGLTLNEKLSIVGSLIRKPSLQPEDVYDTMEHLHAEGIKINYVKLSTAHSVSTKTIQRLFKNNPSLAEAKKLFNDTQ